MLTPSLPEEVHVSVGSDILFGDIVFVSEEVASAVCCCCVHMLCCSCVVLFICCVVHMLCCCSSSSTRIIKCVKFHLYGDARRGRGKEKMWCKAAFRRVKTGMLYRVNVHNVQLMMMMMDDQMDGGEMKAEFKA